jgi:predicted DNA-binding transcriptional regulator AlpA
MDAKSGSAAVPQGARFLTRRQVSELTGYGRTAIYLRERRGEFPKRIYLSKVRAVWLAREIEAWMAAQSANRGEV